MKFVAGLVTGFILTLAWQAQAMPTDVKRGFLCIHEHEGSWHDPDGPYYGGLQMDYGFMNTYGTWLLRNRGTADRWTPRQQLRVAYRAYRGWKGYDGRGFGPWPQTRRLCGV